MNATEILAIPADEPERLFPNNEEESSQLFRRLALSWHPDRNADPLAPRIMAHITMLHRAVLDKIKSGRWAEVGAFRFQAAGKSKRLTYLAKHSFELGDLLVGKELATFVIPDKYYGYTSNGLRRIGSITYPNPRWKADLQPYFPKVERTFFDEEQQVHVTIVGKDADAVLLKDLVRHLGEIDPKHVAWIISCLFNLLSFLETQKLTHNALSVDTVFVSPKRHTAFILGGWWYARPLGKELKTVPPGSFKLLTNKERDVKRASHRLDLACVREIASVCLGSKVHDLPKAFADFLKYPAPSSPVKDYESWGKVLTASYGERRFIKLDVSPSAIYGG